ncbi:SgcJ/EcaC family oxidoreductase [Kitasatospora sp. NPDC001527]|uniref:SgcJ/EcaC family oxidoreductase n=1 Tax=Kitasatospora sp. NPDC001527 TaxID=3154519 RepID=UPI00332ED086
MPTSACEAWDRGDGTAYGALFTVDATDVTHVGTVHRGGPEIGRAHQALFTSFPWDARLVLEVTGIRFPGPDTAVVTTVGLAGRPGVWSHRRRGWAGARRSREGPGSHG